jgi:hypothetical protein
LVEIGLKVVKNSRNWLKVGWKRFKVGWIQSKLVLLKINMVKKWFKNG